MGGGSHNCEEEGKLIFRRGGERKVIFCWVVGVSGREDDILGGWGSRQFWGGGGSVKNNVFYP